jgi:uncharacterized protein (DUF362 family)
MVAERSAQDELMEAEISEHLEAIHRGARGNSRRELDELYLLAVERETLAVVGYGGDGIAQRVGRLAVEPGLRGVVGRALRWASREERGHVILARSLLARSGGLRVRIRAFMADVAGLVAGWAAAILQHTTFWRAPLSQLAARVVTALGRVVGKVPRSAAKELRSRSFAEFCRFQAAAELTAVISWQRIAALLLAEGAATTSYAAIAQRIADDERRHRAVLQVLLDTFGDDDQLRTAQSASDLGAAIRVVDPSFVASSARGKDEHVGRGGAVFVRESEAARTGDRAAVRRLLRETLVATGLLDAVFASAPAHPRVAVKTMFMMTYDRRDPSPHVDVGLAEELALLLREYGASEVVYLESPNHYDRFYEGRSVAEVARYLGLESEHFWVVDVSADQVEHAFDRGFGQASISRTWRDADVTIAFGKMRTHPSWLVHLTMACLESLGRRIDEMIFRDREVELITGAMMLLDAAPPDLSLLDATHHVPDGLTGILGDPKPCHPGRLYAARDPLALDLVAARHMGVHVFPRSTSLSLALDWFDDPRSTTVVDGVDLAIDRLMSPHRNDLTVFLSALSYQAYLFGDNAGSFWMPVMDPAAFPARGAPSIAVRLIRPVLRTLFGFGRPPADRR